MLLLTATNHTLEVSTSTTATVHYTSSWVDITAASFTPDSGQGSITTATTTTVVGAPAASTQRQLKSLILFNAGTATNVVTVRKDVGGVEYTLATFSLLPSYSVEYTDTDGFILKDNGGREVVTDAQSSGITGITSAFFKVGTAPEAAGQWYSWSKDSGFPGAWSPGTPGLNGRATDGTTAADSGCLPLRNAVGANFLSAASINGSVVHSAWLFDVLWVNTGLVVTTTTAQAITPDALPARDITGTTNGEGVWAGILVTTATTNAAAIANTTMSYTNSDGVGGRTATMASFPATAVVGTVVWFQLQAGDKGVRSVQSVTLGTSYVAGAISIILAKPVFNQAVLVANVGGADAPPADPGTRLYNGACLLPIGLMSGTGATTISGSIQVMDR